MEGSPVTEIMPELTNTLRNEAIPRLLDAVRNHPGVLTVIKILQIAGVTFIVYLLFLIIRGILQYKKLSKIGDIKNSLGRIETTLKNIEGNIGTANKKIKDKK